MHFEKYAKKYGDYLFFLFRVLVGLLFAQHGAQKLLGLFGGKPVQLLSLMGAAGTIELIGGLLIAVGLFTRLVALIAGIEMITAYFMAHAKSGLIPIQNKGELALLFLAAFLVLKVYGAKKWSLEEALFKKETF